MAKYTVRHCCGHERVVELFGKGTERERKLEWMAKQDCPQCWGEKQREADAKLPITMSIQFNGLDSDEQGQPLAEIILTGGTMPRKDEIKELGYRWGEVRGGVMNLLSARRAAQAWIKRVRLLDLANETSATWQELKHDKDLLSAQVNLEVNALDMEMARRKVAEEEAKRTAAEERAAKVATIPKPKRPACHPHSVHPDAKWNGKYYGDDRRGYCYYINDKSVKLTKEEYQQCMAYRQALDTYKAACASV